MTQRTAGTDALEQLARLWQQEAAAARARAEAERAGRSLAERVEAGVALDQLAVADLFAVPGPRIGLRLESDRDGAVAASRLRPGDPVLLWRRSPEEREAVRGVVGRRGGRRLDVVVDEAFADTFDAPGFRLDRDAPDVTVARGAAALRRAVEARPGSALGKMREALWGGGDGAAASAGSGLSSSHAAALSFRDVALHPRQQRAVAHALAAAPVALVHGPPGTGKTRVLVEVVRQALGRGERVLCAAASHAAVDHLVAKLGEAGVDVLRIGHPARLDPGTVDCSLDARLEASAAAPMAAKWVAEARKIFAKMDSKRARGSLGRDEARAMRTEARGLLRDARQQLALHRDALIEQARVVAVTCAGADAAELDGQSFDLAVVDEATQAVDPLLLVPLGLCARAVLAGDPEQLPPTVLDHDAAREGLGVTAFERLARRDASAAVMLVRQHRMHEDLMAFPSAQSYGGQLEADAAVAAWRIEALPGVQSDPLRTAPLVLIDAAGAGWVEERTTAADGERGSTFNPEAAVATEREVRALLDRGVPADAIAVLTPYDAQRRLLRQRLAGPMADGLRVDSIDAFQGRESPVVVLDLVRSNDAGEIGFLAETRRMNVALTRAQRLLVVVGDSATLAAHPYYAALLAAVEVRGDWLSVFALTD
ncbi:MAG: AAA family ATPase [Deltaproteobacteria bacterium]|nr:AAA family ATPase [Deltaproteobacteria bacterium]